MERSTRQISEEGHSANANNISLIFMRAQEVGMSSAAMNWAAAVCEAIGAPTSHRIVLMMLGKHHNQKTGECFPSYDTIAKLCGISRRSVINIVSGLEANGLLIRQNRRSGRRQGSNQFVLFGVPKGKEWTNVRVKPSSPREGTLQGAQKSTLKNLVRVKPSSPESLRRKKEGRKEVPIQEEGHYLRVVK